MNQETSKIETIENYRKIVVQANKETPKKEAFISLLTQIYGSNEDTKKVIDAITRGAETPVVNIARKKQIKRESADMLYNKVIIEDDLANSGGKVLRQKTFVTNLKNKLDNPELDQQIRNGFIVKETQKGAHRCRK